MIKLGEKLNIPVKHLANKIISECYQNQCFKLLRFQKTLIMIVLLPILIDACAKVSME